MSTSALTPATAGFGDWDDYLAFAALVEDYDRDDLPEPDRSVHRREHRPARRAADEAAIAESLKGDK